MEKTFFLQYQWFPMGVVFLTALYYLPYLLFKFVNKDFEAMKLLTKGKKAEEVDYDTLIEKFFKGTVCACTVCIVCTVCCVCVRCVYCV